MSPLAEVAVAKASLVAPIAREDAGSLAPLVYGLTVAGDSNVAAYLRFRGITADRIGGLLGLQEHPQGNVVHAQDAQVSSEIAAVVDRARQLAVSFNHPIVACEHLLLAARDYRRENPSEKSDGLDSLPTDEDALRTALFGLYQ